MSICKISYNDFLLSLKQELELTLGEDYIVEHKRIVKNNGVMLDGILIHSFEQSVVPSIYANQYYEQFLSGRSLGTIVEEIISIYENSKEESTTISQDFTYEFTAMKYRITFRVINYEKNKELLEQVPHLSFLDLAITFHCLVRNNEDGIGAVRITNEHISHWDVTVSELLKLAIDNTKRLFPPVLRPMEELIFDLMNQSGDREEDEIQGYMNQNKSCGMYVLTNNKGINGATSILYPEVLNQCKERLQSDFYILPSSIHEVILVPTRHYITRESQLNKERLLAMVTEINETQVAVEEVLSNNVYDNIELLESLVKIQEQ